MATDSTVMQWEGSLRFDSIEGLDRIRKSVEEAAKSFKIDQSKLQAITDAAEKAGNAFTSIIADARAFGLHKDMNRIHGQMRELNDDLAKRTLYVADLEAKLAKETVEAERVLIAEKIKEAKKEAEIRGEAVEAEVKAVKDVISRRTRALAKFQEEVEKSGGAGKMGQEMAADFIGGLQKVDPSDFKGMADAFGKAFKKGGGLLELAGGKMAGAGAGMGGRAGAGVAAAGEGAAALGAAAVSLAAVAAVLAMVVALFFKADKQTKEWNKTLIGSGGAADFALSKTSGGIQDLTGSLDAAREAAIGMSYQFREQPEEILKIVAKANEMGFTFREIEESLGDGVDKMSAYVALTKVALTYSKTLGVSTEEIAETTAQWMHDFGGGLQTIEQGFGAIFAASMSAGIGAKRFFGMVTQATAGMAIYNVRVEEAASLIAELSESLGDAAAAEMVQGLTKGFAAAGYQERIKKLLLAGGKTTNAVFAASAKTAAQTFMDRLQEGTKGEEIKDILKGAKIDMTALAKGDASAIKALSGMGEKQVRALITKVAAKDKATARQLETLIDVSKGTSGNILDQAKAMDELGPGGVLAMQISSANAIIGKPLSEMNAIELMAVEQTTGIAGEQLHALQRVDRQIRGNWEAAQEQVELTKSGQVLSEAERVEMADQLGLIAEEGKLYTAAVVKMADGTEKAIKGQEVNNIEEYLVKQGTAIAEATKEPLSAQEAMAKEMVRNTASIDVLMGTMVKASFEKMADLLQLIYNALSGQDPDMVKARDAIVTSLEEQQAAMTGKLEETKQALSEARVQREQVKGPEREALDAKIAELEERAAAQEAEAKKLGEEAMGVRGAEASGMIRSLFTEIFSGGSRNTMVGAGTSGWSLGGVPGMAIGSLVEGSNQFGFTNTAEGTMEELGLAGGRYGTVAGLGVTEGARLMMSPEEEQDAWGEALKEEVQAPVVKSVDDMSDAQHEEFKELKDKYPELTEKGYIAALKKKEVESLGQIIATKMGTEKAGEFVELRKRGMLAGAEFAKALQESGVDAVTIAGHAKLTPEMLTKEEDFIYRGGAGGGTITPINRADELLGGKPGGPVTAALAAGGGAGAITININGGDTARIYEVVKRAMRESGVRPVPGGRK